MSKEITRSNTKVEVYSWCTTLLLPQMVAVQLIKRRQEAELWFDDDDEATRAASSSATTAAKKARHINAKGKRCGVPLTKLQREAKSSNASDVKPGEFECGCFATLHGLKTNCKNCGRIICQQEAADVCYFCGMDPSRDVKYEIAVQEGKITEAAQQADQERYEVALQRRDALLQYAAEKVKRTAVIDDQKASLFSPQDAWISPDARKQVQKDAAAEERRLKIEELHRHTGAYTVHLDFVNRNVSLGALPTAEEAEKRAKQSAESPECAEDEVTWQDEETVEELAEPRAVAVEPHALQRIWYSTDGTHVEAAPEVPQANSKKKKEQQQSVAAADAAPAVAPPQPAAHSIHFAASKRVQHDYYVDDNAAFMEGLDNALEEEMKDEPLHFDPSLFSLEEGPLDAASAAPAAAASSPPVDTPAGGVSTAMYRMLNTDTGMCLSMHQPWASLLVRGIKTHEGRTWSTNYRGKLWIHAAAHVPTNVKEVEAHYDQFTSSPPQHPDYYPTKALIGYVYVVECLDRGAYEAKYEPQQRQEESPFSFICEGATALPFPLPMDGNHKLFPLDRKVHTAARKQLGEANM